MRSATPAGPRPVWKAIHATRGARAACERSTSRMARVLPLGARPPKNKPSSNSCWPPLMAACSAAMPGAGAGRPAAISFARAGAPARVAQRRDLHTAAAETFGAVARAREQEHARRVRVAVARDVHREFLTLRAAQRVHLAFDLQAGRLRGLDELAAGFQV